ncbi:MAG TPA: hypothetical protein VFN43_07125 [Humibacillus sp.]|nr:hypothetical protein [Humibacillus sp.]
MRWEIPAERLTDDEQLDELLVRASDDWVHPADVFDVARFSGVTHQDAYVEQAIRLTSELLRRGLVIAGDLTEAGYQPWQLGPDESADRIAARWREDPDAAPTSFFVWLQGTASGIARGRRAHTGRG